MTNVNDNNESTLWKGSPSQVINLVTFILCTLTAFLIIPLFVMLWHWLVVKCTQYELTTQRLFTKKGVLNRTTDELELYRVRDMRIIEPWYLRPFGLSTIVLLTTDRTDSQVNISAIHDAQPLLNQVRRLVEESKRKNNYREIDVV